MQQFLHEFGSRIGNPATNPDQEQFIVEQLRDSLGMQVITVGGVSAKTHFAQVMVEADYRMKLIGIGLEAAARAAQELRRPGQPVTESPATPCSGGTSCPTISAFA